MATGNSLNANTLFLLIIASCLLLANLYYSQPILAEMAVDLELPQDNAGIIVAASQLGYITGLLFVAPLGDIIENRKLCAVMAVGAGISALASGAISEAIIFLACVFLMGVFATATQVMVVFAVTLAQADKRGKVLGIMASGLFMGIALSRPVSSFIASIASWRTVYYISGISLICIAALLSKTLPEARKENTGFNYAAILKSLIGLLVKDHKLLRLSLVSAGAFLGFCMFWSTSPIYLAQAIHFSQGQITVFTLAGLVTPPVMLVIGHLLDKGVGRLILLASLGIISLAWYENFCQPLWAAGFYIAAIFLDTASSSATLTIQQFLLASAMVEMRGRVNSLNISMNFCGGAAGAALGPWLLNRYGWDSVSLAGICLMTFLLSLAFMTTPSKTNT